LTWYFVRHGQIHSNKIKVYAGWNDEGLTPLGVHQANETGIALSKEGIKTVYCSPLKRTKQTAQIICSYINCKPVLNDHFIELKMGPWEGLSERDISNLYPEEWRLWNTFPAELSLPGRETLQELQKRVLSGLSSIKTKNKDKELTVLIVTHVAIIRVVQLFFEKKSLNEYKKISVDNGSLFSFDTLNLDILP
jgi:broad specificity phosphatase PhoE